MQSNQQKEQSELLMSIVSQAKRLLLSDEIFYIEKSTSEIDRLAELVEKFEEQNGEVEPQLKPFNKRGWWASFDKPGQNVTLKEILALQKVS